MDYEEGVSQFDAAAEKTIGLGNQLLEQDLEADSWEVASGLLAGAVDSRSSKLLSLCSE